MGVFESRHANYQLPLNLFLRQILLKRAGNMYNNKSGIPLIYLKYNEIFMLYAF
jgi:hypothetical protein